MCNDWMIDVLKDLRGVALKNAMLNLAEQLDDAMMIAVSEMSERGENTTVEEYDRENQHSVGARPRHGKPEWAPGTC